MADETTNVPVPRTLEEPPRSTGDIQQDYPFMLDWFYRAYQVILQSVDYINAQVETIDPGELTELPDPATSTVAVAQQTANAAYTLASADTDHGDLEGLDDDDHSQYALLDGRAGGQIIIGGTESGNSITISSTSHATKGKILFGSSAYDEVNNRMGLDTNSPTETLDINNDTIRIRNSKTPASAGAAGTEGQVAWDANYVYVCVATNTWVRAALATW